MHFRSVAAAFALLFFAVMSVTAQTKTVAERLGYPANAKLLILHADDLGVARSVDAASFAALDKKAVTSASVMVPCPWLTEVAAYARDHRDADFGLHLTLTSEWKTYRWGSVEAKDNVLSLYDPDGYLWKDATLAAGHIKPGEAEREIRAQIERALSLGIRPTHLDSHMGTLFATPELFAVFAKVARDYKLPFLAVKVSDERNKLLALLTENDIVLDSLVMAAPAVRPEGWKEFYAQAIKNLKPGLTEMIVHLGYDDAELRAVMEEHPDYGAAWRQRDFDVVTSPDFKKLLDENHVILIGWKDLKKFVQ